MIRRPLFFLALTAVAVLMAMNLFFASRITRQHYYQKLEEIRTVQNIQLLLVGNSLLTDLQTHALDQSAARTGLKVASINSALAGLLPPEQWLLFHYAMQQHPGIRTLVVGLYDFQLTEPDTTKVSDFIYERMMVFDPRFPVGEVAAAYGFGPRQTLEMRMVRVLPMLVFQGNEQGHVENLRNHMQQMGMQQPLDPGDPDLLEATAPQDFDSQAKAFVQNPHQFNPSFESIFHAARAARMRIVLVIMPMSPLHRSTFYARPAWPLYISAMRAMARRRGFQIDWIDASGWEPSQNDFVDHVHMSRTGMDDFTIRLGSELARVLSPAQACAPNALCSAPVSSAQ